MPGHGTSPQEAKARGGRGVGSGEESVSCALPVALAFLLLFLIDRFLVLRKQKKAKRT